MTGGQHDRGLSSTAGMMLFIALGALMTGAGAYLMLELGNQDIGQTATTAFDARQEGDTVIIEHTAGEAVTGANLKVEGGTPGEIPGTVNTGTKIEVTPTAEEVVLLFEDGRVSQELVSLDVELTRLVVTVEDQDGTPLADHPIGIYNLEEKPSLATPSNILETINQSGGPPEPMFAATTDEDGQFVTATTHRDGLDRGGQYAVLAVTPGSSADRVYAVETVQMDKRENEVTIVLSG